jgi:hypothetical protein
MQTGRRTLLVLPLPACLCGHQRQATSVSSHRSTASGQLVQAEPRGHRPMLFTTAVTSNAPLAASVSVPVSVSPTQGRHPKPHYEWLFRLCMGYTVTWDTYRHGRAAGTEQRGCGDRGGLSRWTTAVTSMCSTLLCTPRCNLECGTGEARGSEDVGDRLFCRNQRRARRR